MVYALLILVVLFVALVIAAVTVGMRLKDQVRAAGDEVVKAQAQRQEAQRQQAVITGENIHLRTAMRELNEQLDQIEQEAADAGAHDAAGVAQRLRRRLSETGV
jgi:predicted Holliday junction resolvase-like endonuclease